MSQCKVWLDNYRGQYYPGSQIQGKVILNFDSETKLRGVKVRIVCKEHTEWMGTESYHDPVANERRNRDTMFQGDNEAFATEIMLYGGNSGTTSLPMGQHMYPFSITLPAILPGTYNCEYGSITFRLIALVDRPMALDYEDQLIFIVVAPVDLNNLRRPDLLEPSSYSEDKTVCCLCCAQGPISLDVELPKKTLVPGETVNVTARLTNMSNTNIEGISLELKQIIRCKVKEPNSEEKEINNVLVELNEVGLGAHGEHTYVFPVMLPINFIIPNFSLCRLFKVEYVSKVVAKLPGVHSNLEVFMYPEIGNIQMGQSMGGFQAPPPGEYQYPPSGNGYQPNAPENYPPYPGGAGEFQPPQPGVMYPTLPGGQYPPYPGGPGGFNPKAQEAGIPSAPSNVDEHPPPSYDSLDLN